MIGERVAALIDGPFCYSRALDPAIRVDLKNRPNAEELPFVRGQTVVVEGETRPVVLGHPNYLGMFEPQNDAETILVVGRWNLLRPAAPSATLVVVDEAVDRVSAERLLDGARALLKRLRQIRGVQPAWKPQSPVLTMLLPRDVGPITGVDAIVTSVLDYPELPGGVRIEVTGDVSTADITRYAATLERAIIQEA